MSTGTTLFTGFASALHFVPGAPELHCLIRMQYGDIVSHKIPLQYLPFLFGERIISFPGKFLIKQKRKTKKPDTSDYTCCDTRFNASCDFIDRLLESGFFNSLKCQNIFIYLKKKLNLHFFNMHSFRFV